MSENGHGPVVTDLAELLERTKPARTVMIPRERLNPRSVTLTELAMAGRALGMTPEQIGAIDTGSWAAFDLQQALVWVILRREEPELTWAEAQRFALEFAPADPTPPVKTGSSRKRGTPGASTSTASPGSRPPTPGS